MQYVNYRQDGPIVTIELNRPERLNALGTEIYADLCEAWTRFRDDPDARVGVLTTSGRSFSAGLDVKEMAERGERPYSRPEDPFLAREVLKPVIGATRGHVLGAGLTLLLGCDLRVAGESTKLGMPEILRGFIAGGIPFPPQRLPTAVAMELNLLGRELTAQRAYEVGLVNRVVPDDEVDETARALAEQVARTSPRAAAAVKKTLYEGVRVSAAARAYKEALYAESFGSNDAIEGARAWAEGRSPTWRGD